VGLIEINPRFPYRSTKNLERYSTAESGVKYSARTSPKEAGPEMDGGLLRVASHMDGRSCRLVPAPGLAAFRIIQITVTGSRAKSQSLTTGHIKTDGTRLQCSPRLDFGACNAPSLHSLYLPPTSTPSSARPPSLNWPSLRTHSSIRGSTIVSTWSPYPSAPAPAHLPFIH